MTTADGLNFKVNQGLMGIVKQGKSIDWNEDFIVEAGDSVTLICDDNKITVDDVELQGDHFKGMIRGFECGGVEFKGLKLRDNMTFKDEHVFTCCKK